MASERAPRHLVRAFVALTHLHGASVNLARLVQEANETSRESRRPGPQLSEDSTVEEIAAWLQWCDPNGLYTANLRTEYEGLDPLTKETAWAEVANILCM